MMSGSTVFGPQQLDRLLTVRDVKELVEVDVGPGGAKRLLLGTDVLDDDKVLAEFGIEVSFCFAVDSEPFHEQFALLKQLCGEVGYTSHPSGQWVIVETVIDEFHSDSTNPFDEKGSDFRCFDLSSFKGDTLPSPAWRQSMTIRRSRGGTSDSTGTVCFAPDGPPALLIKRGSSEKKVELGSSLV
mmetsp:Transcript_42758/g.96510  ORF Transcript_42758/g.96510 Transcript_42758/m.96510 type:complete len:185 (+) Transcript_42758:110-664(+)